MPKYTPNIPPAGCENFAILVSDRVKMQMFPRRSNQGNSQTCCPLTAGEECIMIREDIYESEKDFDGAADKDKDSPATYWSHPQS
jgi:hypothetical protein